jgi:hypothetical protein
VVICVHLPSSPLVSASRILALSLAATFHLRILLIYLGAAVVKAQRERVGRQAGYRIVVMCVSVRARCFRVGKLSESFVTNTGLTKVVHCNVVASCNQIHLR